MNNRDTGCPNPSQERIQAICKVTDILQDTQQEKKLLTLARENNIDIQGGEAYRSIPPEGRILYLCLSLLQNPSYRPDSRRLQEVQRVTTANEPYKMALFACFPPIAKAPYTPLLQVQEQNRTRLELYRPLTGYILEALETQPYPVQIAFITTEDEYLVCYGEYVIPYQTEGVRNRLLALVSNSKLISPLPYKELMTAAGEADAILEQVISDLSEGQSSGGEEILQRRIQKQVELYKSLGQDEQTARKNASDTIFSMDLMYAAEGIGLQNLGINTVMVADTYPEYRMNRQNLGLPPEKQLLGFFPYVY